MKIETDSFEIDNLRTLARLAKAAYDDQEVAAWATSQNFLVTGLPANAFDTQGVIATQPDAVILAFRGTEPAQLKDWAVDAQAVRLGAAGLTGTVHIGFVRALDAVWAGIESTVRNQVAAGKKLWITGHSLGGALAVLAACRLSDLKPGVYTFGQPRVGDEAFADTYDSRIGSRYFRFINDKDIVARVPPFTAGYRHFGREMQVTPSLHEADSGVETASDAFRLAAGSATIVPKKLQAISEVLLRAVDSLATSNPTGFPNFVEALAAILPGGEVARFLKELRSRSSAIELLKQHPGALEVISDHAMDLYIKAVES